MTEPEYPTEAMRLYDRKAGLIIFGVIQLIFGGICALLVPFMILAAAMSAGLEAGSAPPVTAATMIPAVIMYSLLAVWFVCMGIGSIMARRWARALLLVSSWLWLVCGISGMLFMALMMPDMLDRMAEDGKMPQGAGLVVKYFAFTFMTVLYVIIPGAHILFYRSKHVKATCEYRDPKIRWTDKCPLPVLALSLTFGFGAFWLPSVGLYGWAFPFFGVILEGMAGAAAVLVTMFLLAYVAWGAYKLRIKAWQCSVLLTVGWTVSSVITFSRVSMSEYYEKMNLPPQQLEMLKQYSLMEKSSWVLFLGLWVAVVIGYLLYIRKYFLPVSEADI